MSHVNWYGIVVVLVHIMVVQDVKVQLLIFILITVQVMHDLIKKKSVRVQVI